MSADVATLSLKAYKGEDYVLAGTHKVSSSGAVQDITGWTIKLTLRRQPSSTGTPLLQVTGTVVSGTAGAYTVPLTSAQLDALDPGDYAADLWRTNSGAQTEMGIGVFTLAQPVYHQP
jgi:hypothetical protein